MARTAGMCENACDAWVAKVSITMSYISPIVTNLFKICWISANGQTSRFSLQVLFDLSAFPAKPAILASPGLPSTLIVRVPLSVVSPLKECGKRLTTHAELHRDGGVHFHRLAIQDVRLVSPLLHRFHRVVYQHGMAADHLQAFNRPLFADYRLKNNVSGDVGLLRDGRIYRLDLIDQ